MKLAQGPLANFAALGSSEVIARAIGFYATALLARKLGVEAFGYVGFALAIIAYFGFALNVGFADIGAREVARNSGSPTRLAADGTAMRLLVAITGIAAIVIIALSSPFSTTQTRVLILASATLIPVALDTTWVFRGLARNQTAALTLLLAQILYLAGVIFLVHSPGEVTRVPLIQVAGDGVAALILVAVLFRGGIPRPSLSGGMSMLRQSGYITLSRVFRTFIVTFDVILLGAIAGSHNVGLYTAAYRVCMLITSIAVATHVAYLPAISHATHQEGDTTSDVLGRSLGLTSAVILPLCVGGILLSTKLLSFVFGAEYSEGSLAFQILLSSIALLAIHGTMHNVFVGTHRTGREAALFGAGAILNLVLCVILIPTFEIAGAAIATLAAEILILGGSVISLKGWGISIQFSRMMRSVLASGAMAAMLLVVRDRVPVIASVAAGAMVYVALFAFTGGLRSLRDPKSS